MQELVQQIQHLQQTEIKQKIGHRLAEFQQFQTAEKSAQDWFSEFCFCLLTANAKSKTACAVQREIGAAGFATLSREDLVSVIKRNKHRFHNTKAKYIVAAREHQDIKEKILQFSEQKEMREWLVANIKGYGYKEASHFLRNVGFRNLAILDRHVITLMAENKLIEKPKNLNKRNYIKIEGEFKKICDRTGMSCAELDMYMWHLKTG